MANTESVASPWGLLDKLEIPFPESDKGTFTKN